MKPVLQQPLSLSSSSSEPRVIVCVGGGGVGKTTTAAALALALAAAGSRTLIVTIDPARRLAGALGVPISDEVTPVALPIAAGRLHALMPDPKRSLHTFLDYLFEGKPEGRARLLTNSLYIGLSDAAAGMHELVAMTLVAKASAEGRFDVVVIDTAPSRHAIDFVTYPGRLAALLGGRTVGWLAGLAERSNEDKSENRKARGWTAARVESLLARVAGPNLLRDTAALFAELATVRERFVALTESASKLLLGEHAAYVLVAAPTAAARDDVLYLAKRLEKLGRSPRAVVLNRADIQAAPFVQALKGERDLPASIVDALAVLEEERASRTAAAATLERELRPLGPVPVLRLPFIEESAPEAIVMALRESLAPHLQVLLPER
jgi:anion-transporting  ArsA/GET3 family ATPase